MYVTVERQCRDLLVRLVKRQRPHFLRRLALLHADRPNQPAREATDTVDLYTHGLRNMMKEGIAYSIIIPVCRYIRLVGRLGEVAVDAPQCHLRVSGARHKELVVQPTHVEYPVSVTGLADTNRIQRR